ncbi:MAG: acetate/propionate family kinase [Alphaproteobacteria bacterium]|jgi:acetate kinase|nr:acetate/propionate family kinase [Alphaproteobacteria bacterium]
MSKESMIIINAGSSSIKFKLFEKNNLQEFSYGQITGIGTEKVKMVVKKTADGSVVKEEILDNKLSRDDVLVHLISTLTTIYADITIISAGHRIVHGADKYIAPTVVNNDVIAYLKSIEHLSPIHLPHNIRPMEVLQSKFPNIKQVACFDTSFHATNPKYTKTYAIPKELSEKDKIVRYGFHGISYQYISEALSEKYPELYKGKVVVCHLGAGASLCALVEGKSFTTTMGFTPLEGLVMGSRTGDIDPGILLHLMNHKGYSVKELTDMLYYKSGVLGLSGISSDFYVLETSSEPAAKEALDVYNYNLIKSIGSMIAVMGGVDALVFTAGVGENSVGARKAVANAFAYLGVELDDAANKSKAEVITKSSSKVKMLVLPTNEELMIAKQVAKLI